MATFTELLANLDHSPKVKGDQFEHICKWFLENEPGYRSQLKRVWLWSEWPDAWAPDAGIDLVAEAASGDLWAIQAKAYSEDHSITKRDVDTFLSESSRPQFTFRLLIATTNEIGSNAQAEAIESMVEEVQRAYRQFLVAPLSLKEASNESGYTVDHLGRQVRMGRIPNAGRMGSPRILRRHLPRKLSRPLASADSALSCREQIARSVVDSG